MAGSGSRLRVAVVGAGAAGLVALRHLAANPRQFEAMAFEMTPNVSGTWVYTDRTGTDERGLPLHISMYKNLRTNLPKEVMAFPDFPFKPGRSFISHQDVRQYLEDYSEHYKLNQLIAFNTLVERISLVEGEAGSTKWQVDVRDVTAANSQTKRHVFDAVMVCNGHYSVPLIPDIPGLSTFKGQLVHSHDYRIPEVFTGKRVAILGAAASGQDICVDISRCCQHVYLCHRQAKLQTALPANVTQHQGMKQVRGNTIILSDGAEIKADVILLCTGYRYNFEFLSDECRLSVKDERLTPLYKHIIHTKHPTLSFIGIVKTVCPFPLFDCQVQFALASLAGKMSLPSTADMDKDTETDFQWRLSKRLAVRHAHTMGTLQWPYNDELADLGGFPRIPRVVRTLYDQVHMIRTRDIASYKNVDYELVSDTEYREVTV